MHPYGFRFYYISKKVDPIPVNRDRRLIIGGYVVLSAFDILSKSQLTMSLLAVSGQCKFFFFSSQPVAIYVTGACDVQNVDAPLASGVHTCASMLGSFDTHVHLRSLAHARMHVGVCMLA